MSLAYLAIYRPIADSYCDNNFQHKDPPLVPIQLCDSFVAYHSRVFNFTMQSILRSLLVFAVLVLVTADSGFYNGNYCAQHLDCKVDEFCNNNSACECLPNMVLNPISKNCSQIACDPEFKSCPGSASCVRNVCTKYCDMEANNCR